MAVKDFYKLNSFREAAEGNYQAEISLNPDCEVYKGHFPGQPIAPGVCLLQMLKEVINEMLGANFKIVEAQQIKFLSTVEPDKCPSLTLDILLQPHGDGYKLRGGATHEGTAYFKVNAILG